MINKKAFTLIEILAVIVLLAIASLISVPLITGVLESAKLSAFENSLNNIFNEVNIYTATEDNQTIPEDGLDIDVLNLKGNLISGSIILNIEGIVEIVNVSDGKYCGNGTLHNYIIYKGSCDSNVTESPTVIVNNLHYDTTASYTITNLVLTNGIEGFEYYLSDSITVPSKNVTASGISTESEVIINEVSKYVFFRVVKTSSLKSPWTNAFINYVDLTAPTSSLVTSVITSNSIMLAATCNDEKSGITKYEFSKDNGTTYIDNLTGNVYTFNNLSSNTYSFKVRCTNGASMTSISSISASTVSIEAPTYSISPSGYATSKTLTITYPSGYTNEYSINGGTSWVTYTAPIVFNTNGSVIARVNDGTNYVTGSSYTITNIDTTNPTVSVSVSGKVGTITLGDNLQLSGYTVTTSTTVPTVWTSLTGTSSSQSYTGTVAGTYYAWVKDAAGNTAYSSFVLAANAFCAYTAGNIWNFAYNGGIQTFTVPCSGTYKLEVWGAQGGSNTYNQGGLGGLATGNRVLTKDNIIYIVVGGQGDTVTSQTQTGTGGYNGGGTATYRNVSNYRCSGGGGATHMALTTGVLSSIGYTSGVTNGNLLLVGGGGGGGYFDGGNSTGQAGFIGGGTTGGGDYGGTQTANTYSSGANPGGFGFGSASTFSSGAGGGGLYGGGSAYYVAGSGGSGYLSSSLTSSSMTSGARAGNGYARITLISY